MKERKLKVSLAWKNKKNVPSIRLMGNWLREAGFEAENDIILFFSKDEIIIKKK